MKAVLQTRSGPPDVLTFAEIDRPIPGNREILVRVHVATVAMGDVMLRKLPRLLLRLVGLVVGFSPKTVAGVEFAGEVFGIGPGVTRFAIGDRVFGTTTGLTTGAYAEFLCIPEEWKMGVVTKIPPNVSDEVAAVLPVGGMTALQLLRKVGVKAGDRVLVYGASGSVGTYAVQLAVHMGAAVTGVCSTPNVELVRSLGASSVVDYTKEDVARRAERYDVVLDAVGKLASSRVRSVLAPGGRSVSIRAMTKETLEDLGQLATLASERKVKPVIDRRYRFDDIVEAHRYVESWRKRGNVVIQILERS